MGMQVRVYTGPNEAENLVLKAFYEGCPEPKKLVPLTDYQPSDVAVIMGTFKRYVPVSYHRGDVLFGQRDNGGLTIILETGYINRGAGPNHHYAAGFNGINGRAFFNNKNSPSDRWLKLGIPIMPWRREGGHILLCGQVPWDASVDFINFQEWTQKTAALLKTLSKREIVYRPHPLGFTDTPEGCVKSPHKLLSDDLKNCWAVVTFNSNSAVEAAIAGVPVVACDIGSMALPVANALEEVEKPRTPDRTQWLNDLAYCQWTPEEMRSGETWQHLFRLT